MAGRRGPPPAGAAPSAAGSSPEAAGIFPAPGAAVSGSLHLSSRTTLYACGKLPVNYRSVTMARDNGSWLSDSPHGLSPQGLAVTTLGAYGRRRTQPVWSGGMVRLLG